MLFDTNDIEELSERIDLFHNIFIAENIGYETLSRTDRSLLKKYGYGFDDFKRRDSFLTYAYSVGKLQTDYKSKNQLQNISFKDFKEFVALNQQRIPVSRAEQTSIKLLKQNTYNDIKRLANDIKADFTHDLLEVSKTQRLKVERLLKKQTKGKKVQIEEILGQLKNRLVANTKKWRDRFELICSYRMHSAYHYGIADELFSKHGLNVRVWFSVHPDACQSCKDIYLYPNGTPKIFYLKNIIANGSNIGRKIHKGEGVPSVDPIHPRCRCKMNVYLYGSKYNKKRNQYVEKSK